MLNLGPPISPPEFYMCVTHRFQAVQGFFELISGDKHL
jgi:hypothetical protein